MTVLIDNTETNEWDTINGNYTFLLYGELRTVYLEPQFLDWADREMRYEDSLIEG